VGVGFDTFFWYYFVWWMKFGTWVGIGRDYVVGLWGTGAVGRMGCLLLDYVGEDFVNLL